MYIRVTIITGITGNVSIDDNGDRNADYSLLDMDPDTGEFEVTIYNLIFTFSKQSLKDICGYFQCAPFPRLQTGKVVWVLSFDP